MSWIPPSNDSPVSSGSEDSSSSSEVQNHLQSVLVRVKIQERSKQPYEKKVRFNSLVEVRFIPKVKSKKHSDKNKEAEKDKTEPHNESAEVEKGKDVANGNDANLLEEKNKERNASEKNTTNEACKTETKSKNAKNLATSSATKSFDGGEIHVNVVAREGLCLPKVTIGQEYEGAQVRTSKAVPILQPRNSIHRHQRRGNFNESRINSLSAKAVIHLERQATEFYKQANTMLFGQEERKDLENQENFSSQSTTRRKCSADNLGEFQDGERNRLYRSKSLPEFRRSSLQLVDPKEAKDGEEVRPMTEATRNKENMSTKLSTSLPYINITPNVTGKTRRDSKDSYTKLYLPQLHRRSEEIKRLNETVLKKKPKYSSDKQPSSPQESISPLDFGVEKKNDKNESPPASSHSIVRYTHGLDIARLLNTAHFFY